MMKYADLRVVLDEDVDNEVHREFFLEELNHWLMDKGYALESFAIIGVEDAE